MINKEELSKEISYALRHAPWEYELELDEAGWVPISQLINALSNSPKWKGLEENNIIEMINQSSKKRHEVNGNKIRALYGHSTPLRILKIEAEPPYFLYHGTTHKAVNGILKEGLLPQKRQYVHLSEDVETAISVGKRRDNSPIILVIDASTAYKEGVKFYLGNEKVWLSSPIPSKYITIKQ